NFYLNRKIYQTFYQFPQFGIVDIMNGKNDFGNILFVQKELTQFTAAIDHDPIDTFPDFFMIVVNIADYGSITTGMVGNGVIGQYPRLPCTIDQNVLRNLKLSYQILVQRLK